MKHAWPYKSGTRSRSNTISAPAPETQCCVSTHDDVQGLDKCVVTVCIGNAAHGLEPITIPLMRDYARRCGADFRVVRDVGECQHPKFAIMQLPEICGDYDRILYLDADVIVKPNAPDIFAAHAAGKFYARNEAEFQPRSWCVQFHNEMCRRLGSDEAYDGIHFNGGVLLFDRDHMPLFQMPPYDVTAREFLWTPQRIVKNQPWLNHRRLALGIPFAPLDDEWNCLMGDDIRDGDASSRAKFMHLATEKPHKSAVAAKFLEGVTIDSRRVCLATVCVGADAGECAKYSLPAMAAYCQRCGYDLHVITRTGAHMDAAWARFDALRLLGEYDIVVYVDNDVIIKPNAPPITWFLPANGEWDYAAFNSGELSYMRDRAKQELSIRARILGEREPETDGSEYCNAGVCAFNSTPAMREYNPFETAEGWKDQTALAYDALSGRLRWHKIGREWNWGHLHISGNRRRGLTDGGVFFVHWTGVPYNGGRADDMRRFVAEMEART